MKRFTTLFIVILIAFNCSVDDRTDNIQKIYVILSSNSSLNFVDRILNPDNYPVLMLNDSDFATHKMAWSTDDNGIAYVYPTIIYDANTKSLIQLSDIDAYNYAISSGEFIQFNNYSDADFFSINYKLVWN